MDDDDDDDNNSDHDDDDDDDDDEQALMLPPGGMELLSPSFAWLGSPTARDHAFARASNSSYETTRSSEFARENNLSIVIPHHHVRLARAPGVDADGVDIDPGRAPTPAPAASPGPLTALLNSHIAGAQVFLHDRASVDEHDRAYRAFMVSPAKMHASESPRAL